jgi:hypothetical protein
METDQRGIHQPECRADAFWQHHALTRLHSLEKDPLALRVESVEGFT